MKTINIKLLPSTIQEQVLECLTAFTTTYVTRENGQYDWTPCIGLDTRVKAPDFATFEFKNTDFYSQEQITEFNKALPDMNW